ncbi:hypothetical protein SAMN05443144_1295 [Fodinibius roseus]|uniref:Uncharacterized protein n=1 Tax=Fodinibius roseus TaxID=1194090 RepID=A0A1M5JZM8_9BACT|nr:hypothetical protein [Fodinibius roseus]SHG46011.1 hypothetical protein SAMN05443144_1295 [Fodinibius roseus]
MLIQLLTALLKALKFRNINLDTICRVDDNVGFIWFKAEDKTYCISIQQANFDLEEYHDQEP